MKATKPTKSNSAEVYDEASLPLYDSMTSCAAQTGIPLDTIKLAKRGGCVAFKNRRVALGPLLRWLFQNQNEDGINWGNELNKAKTLRERIRLRHDEGETLDRGQVAHDIAKASALYWGELDRAINSELPSSLSGKSPIEICKELNAMAESLKAALRAGLEKMEQPAAAEPETKD
jgi:hypothetical protein